MITGEVKNRIDQIWDTFWTGGITNSLTVLEQMTYLFFMKMLDDAQMKKEANAAFLGAAIDDPVFKEGNWHNPILIRMFPMRVCAGMSLRTRTRIQCSTRYATMPSFNEIVKYCKEEIMVNGFLHNKIGF